MRAERMMPLTVVILVACTNAAENKVEEVRPVRVVEVGETASAGVVEYAGEVKPRHEVRLSFRVGGKIVERFVELGATVRGGQPIARLDAADLALAAASAKAQAASLETDRNLAQADLKRYRELREKHFISQAEYERRASTFEAAEAKLAAARAAQRQAANQASYAVLVADGPGVITGIEAEAGQVVAAGQTVARLARLGEVEVAFAVPEAQRELVEHAVSLAMTLNARPGRTWQAKLRELSPLADPVTRTYAARATLLEAGEALELGMSARVVVRAAAAAPRIEVPLAALHSRDDVPQVYVVDAQGLVHPRAVKTAGISGEQVAIESGLAPGDVVVAAGAALLRPGQKVRVLRERP